MEEHRAPSLRPDPQLFFEALKASPIGIALENMEGRPLFANPALCAMLGFSEEELCRKHCVDFSPPEDANKDWALFERLRSGLLKRYTLEKRFFRRDGSLFKGRLSIFLLSSTPHPLVVAMVEEISDRKTEQEGLAESQASLQKSLAGHLIQSQEDERSTLARELHNRVNDPLLLLGATLDRLQRDLPESMDEVRLKIGETREQLLDISKIVYELSYHLHSWKLEFLGLDKAAASVCREFADREQVEIEFVSENVPQAVPQDIALALFRFLQEALHIAIKNSVLRKFQVSLSTEANEIHLTVREPGGSFSPERIMTEGALSVATMQERVRMVNGVLSLSSEPQSGTRIDARVPLAPNATSGALG
jgi:PAS domain S-box-containing protein